MSKVSILAISDIHVGCPRLDPVLLHKKFEKYVYPQITSEISILFICGDFFDTLLTLNAHAAFEAMCIIKELKVICKSVGCDLRVLRGTYTHDRTQPKHFINGEREDDKSVRLFEELSVEHHEKTGLNILYIPDNIKCDNIYDNIRSLLDNHGIDKVDILVHHGYFKHMLPEALLIKGLPSGCLEVDKIQKYVKGCVLNGHVHQSSIYQNVISIGSFDRLAHGEDEPKGFYRINIEDGKYQFEFIENKDASKFVTFNLMAYNAEHATNEFVKRFSKYIENLPEEELIRVRVVCADKTIVEGCRQAAKTLRDSVLVDQAAVSNKEQTIDNIALDLSELPQITEANLCDLLMPILHKRDPQIKESTVMSILDSVGCTQPKSKEVSNAN